MAHYIDLCKVKIVSEKFFDENEDALISVGDVRRALLMAPVEDVAPRAEVEYWKEQCFHACMNNGCLDKAIVDAAVAREIFEEIEKYMMDSVDVTHTAYKTIGTSTFAILKKKYTGEE